MPDNPGMPMMTPPEEAARIAAQVAEPPKSSPQTPSEPWVRNGLYFGKYKTLEDADKAHWELHETLTKRSQELDANNSRLAALEAALTERGNPAKKSPYDELAEQGIDPTPLRAAVLAEVQAALEPLAAGMRAKQQVAQRFPDYANAENEVVKFLDGNPDLQARFTKMFQSDPVGASEWAYLSWREQKGQRVSAADEVTKADASLPSTTGQRQVPPPDQEDRIKKALEYYNTYRDDAPYRRERLKGLIPDSHFEE